MRPRSWERARALLAVIALTTAATGAAAVVMAVPAYADVTTNTYAIGTVSGPVSAVSAQPTTTTAGTPTKFEVRFAATVPLSGGTTITIGDSTAADRVAAGATQVQLLDSAATCLEPSPTYTAQAGTGLTVTLGGSCSISAGDTAEVDFTASVAGLLLNAFTFDVVTSANATAATSNPITVGPAPPTVSASSLGAGANAVYTVRDVPVQALSSGGASLVLVARAVGGSGTVAWYSGASGYTVTYTPTGGAAVAIQVSSAVVSRNVNTGDTVTLTLASALADNGSVSVTAEGTNPAAGSTDAFTVTPGNGTPGTTTNDVAFGSSVSEVSVTASPAVAGSSATYTVSFRATTVAPAGDDIFLSEPGTDFSHVTGILVSDGAQGWHFVAAGATLSAGAATVPLSQTISTGDTVALSLVNVINPGAGPVSDFEVSTTADAVPAAAPTYTVGASSGSGVTVAVSPAAPATQATYTISNLHASAALVGGSGTITVSAPAGTIFPNNATYYFVQDSTTSTGSGTVSAVYGGGSSTVLITVPQTINGGDTLSIAIEDAINPGTSGIYTISVEGNVVGSAAGLVFPSAGVAYPDAALLSFSGTLYVFAGGHAFGVPSPGVAARLEAVDHAVVSVSPGTAPSTTALPGTLVVVYDNPTIYVVGTDGRLHGFATPAQFVGDGYDPADVITVPNLGGIRVGATAGATGAAANALATASNGAIVDSAGTYFVLAGGRAFGIPNPTALKSVRATDAAKPLSGSIGSLRGASIADGTLVTVGGTVYVSYGDNLFPFKSRAQLVNDGYGGTPSIAVPSTGGLNVVAFYSGS
jgi:hypothetical protein